MFAYRFEVGDVAGSPAALSASRRAQGFGDMMGMWSNAKHKHHGRVRFGFDGIDREGIELVPRCRLAAVSLPV